MSWSGQTFTKFIPRFSYEVEIVNLQKVNYSVP